jgi:hypothetical protein
MVVLLVMGGHLAPLTQLRTGLAQIDTYPESSPEADDGDLDAVIRGEISAITGPSV